MEKENNGIIAKLKTLNFIDEESRVTVQGIDILSRCIENESNAETASENKEWIPEYVKTWDMSQEEVEEWEKENHAVSISCGDDILEAEPTKYYHIDRLGQKVYSREMLGLSVAHINSEEDCFVVFHSKQDIIKLRDYLTKFIEKDVEWYKTKE